MAAVRRDAEDARFRIDLDTLFQSSIDRLRDATQQKVRPLMNKTG